MIEWFSWQRISVPESSDAGEGAYISRNFTIGEVPVYSRPGTIIPMRTIDPSAVGGNTGGSLLGSATRPMSDVTFTVLPVDSTTLDTQGTTTDGKTVFTKSTRMYDDDGATVRYEEQDEFTWTPVECQWTRERTAGSATGDSIRCVVSPYEGKAFRSMPEARTYTWRFIGSLPPAEVRINGKTVTRDSFAVPDANGDNGAWVPGQAAWGFEGSTLSTWVYAGEAASVSDSFTIELLYAPGAGNRIDEPQLTSGLARRIARAVTAKEEMDTLYGALFPSDFEHLLNVTAAATRLSAARDAKAATRVLKTLTGDLERMLVFMQTWQVPSTHKAYGLLQRCIGGVYDAIVQPTVLNQDDARFAAADADITFTWTIGPHLEAPPGVAVGPDGLPIVDESAGQQSA